MEAVGSVSVARTRFLKKMYEYKCVRQAGFVLEYAHLRDNLYQCTGCNCITELPLLRQYLREFVLNIIFSTATM